jgi:ATP-binding cassette subfamily F protein uup
MSNGNAPTLINATDLAIRYNDQVVLDGASLNICGDQRIGMVGRNGSGKSTLLRILTGEYSADSGEITRKRDLRIGYLSQKFDLDKEASVLENVRSGAAYALGLIERFESPDLDENDHHRLEQEIMTLGAWEIDNRVETVMTHLNAPDGDRLVGQLSGGEMRRVALCSALVSQPDLLILDEPTNHLDTESIQWMGDFLTNFKGAFLLVTHDRYFLDRITSTIIEVANGKCFQYTGNYTTYLESKAERLAMEAGADSKRRSFIRRELDWIRRGPKARGTKAKARVDRFNDVSSQSGPELEVDVEMVIPPPQQLGNRIVQLSNASVERGGNRLFSNLSFNFENGMKIGILGRNGVGKTSLLKLILGELSTCEGTIKSGALTQINYVDQARLHLDDEKTVLEEASDGTEFVVFGNGQLSVRAYLKRFLFADHRINTLVKSLSGGERSRLLLAKVLKRGGNFLILDEPTNDLDLPTLRILEEALMVFTGVVLVVSHDRYFLNRVCTGILAFEDNGEVVYSEGDYDYYCEKKANPVQRLPTWPKESRKAASSAKASSTEAKARPRKLTWKEQKEVEGMEKAIMQAEGEVERIEGVFASPEFHEKHASKTKELQQELVAAKAKAKKLYARWEELESLAKAEG